jgi:hypothetical protein
MALAVSMMFLSAVAKVMTASVIESGSVMTERGLEGHK